MINRLNVKKVVIIDFQEPYSLGLADAVETVAEGEGRRDDASLGSEHDDRLLGVRDEGAERRGRRLLPDAEAGRRADVRAAAARAGQEGEGVRRRRLERLRRSSRLPGSYVSNFAPDITGIPADKAIIAGWKKDNPGKAVGSFGPPTYGAAQVALNAIKKACNAGHGSIRSGAP